MPLNLTLVEELLNQREFCLKNVVYEAEEGEFKLHAWAVAEEAGGCSSPLSPILDMPLSLWFAYLLPVPLTLPGSLR